MSRPIRAFTQRSPRRIATARREDRESNAGQYVPQGSEPAPAPHPGGTPIGATASAVNADPLDATAQPASRRAADLERPLASKQGRPVLLPSCMCATVRGSMTVPITILTGFLGSGKTTLLNHALRGPLLARALVVVNELGAVPLDHLLVKEVREDVLLLDSGCVCCSIRGDLVETLLAQTGGEACFDRVLVETTGLADPTPIIATLVRHPDLSRHYHLDAIVTAVDGQHAPVTLARHDEARKQVLLADDLILTKLDVASARELHAARTAAEQLNPQARLFSAERGVLDWRPILEWTPSTVSSRLDAAGIAPPHAGDEVRSFFVRVDRAVDFRSFALWLSMVSQFHGETLLRVKGLLRVDEEPGPVVVQAVQHVVYPTYSMPNWPSDDRSSRIVVITRGMPAALVEQLRSSLDGLLRAPSALPGARRDATP